MADETMPTQGLTVHRDGEPAAAPSQGFSPLSVEEQAAFDYLRAALSNRIAGAKPCLFRVRHRGRDRAVVAVATDEVDGEVTIRPLALLVDDSLFDDLDPGSDV